MNVQVFEQPLTKHAMTQVMEGIITGQRSEEEIRAFLTTLAKRGEIPSIRTGRAVRYAPPDLLAWIERKKSYVTPGVLVDSTSIC